MAKRRNKSDPVIGIIMGISLLIGLGAMASGVYSLEVRDLAARLAISGGFGFVAALTSIVILSVLFAPRRKKEPTVDFDEKPRSRQQSASAFEHEVAGLIKQLTGNRTEIIGGSGDGGIDIKVYGDDGRLVGIVQCKKVAATRLVSPAYIRELNTVRHYHQVNIAYLVTTGRFSQKSEALANELGVRLVDGDAIEKLRAKVVNG
jgi:HJR/Mrr/RecB family endonuclease